MREILGAWCYSIQGNNPCFDGVGTVKADAKAIKRVHTTTDLPHRRGQRDPQHGVQPGLYRGRGEVRGGQVSHLRLQISFWRRTGDRTEADGRKLNRAIRARPRPRPHH